MFGEFNEAAQLKTSLAKYSIEFNDLAVQTRSHRIPYLSRIPYLRLLDRPYTFLYVSRSVGRLRYILIFQPVSRLHAFFLENYSQRVTVFKSSSMKIQTEYEIKHFYGDLRLQFPSSVQ